MDWFDGKKHRLVSTKDDIELKSFEATFDIRQFNVITLKDTVFAINKNLNEKSFKLDNREKWVEFQFKENLPLKTDYIYTTYIENLLLLNQGHNSSIYMVKMDDLTIRKIPLNLN